MVPIGWPRSVDETPAAVDATMVWCSGRFSMDMAGRCCCAAAMGEIYGGANLNMLKYAALMELAFNY